MRKLTFNTYPSWSLNINVVPPIIGRDVFFITRVYRQLPKRSVDKYEEVICTCIALILIWSPCKRSSLPVI